MERILIVDDVDLNRKILKYLFKSIYNNVIIDEAQNGDIALHMMKKENYDLTFLDIHMPKMNGDEVVKKFREFENKNSKDRSNIIALSGSLEENNDYDKNFLHMVTDYMIKPITKDKILKAVKMCGYSKSVRFE